MDLIMPELPEVETVCRTLRPHLIGKTISLFHLNWHRTLEQPSLDEFMLLRRRTYDHRRHSTRETHSVATELWRCDIDPSKNDG